MAVAVRTVAGTCPLDCPDSCAWQIDVAPDGRAVALRGDRDHPYTRGTLCGKVNRYLDLVYSEDRLLHPLRRVGAKGEGRFERIGWDDAIGLAAEGIRKAIDRHGPESVLPYHFAGTLGLVQAWTLGPRLFRALGASRLKTTICTAAASAATKATLGGNVGMDPEAIADSRLVILWGSNPLATHLHQWRFVLEARERGAHIVCIDPLRSASAERSDEHIAPIPGTDGALALGLMRVVLDEGCEDRDWLERHTVGWPELEERLAGWPVERAARVCGLDPEVVRGLGRRLAHTRPTALRVGLGLQRHFGAGAAIRAVMSIPAVTGDWRHAAGGAVCMTGGHFPLDDDTPVSPAGMVAPPARTINMSRLAEALLDLDDPPVHAMVVWATNPAAAVPDQSRLRRGLARDDLFTVVLEQRRTDTADFADVVLPVTMQPEHFDLHDSYGHLYVSLNTPAIEPPGECLSNTDVFRRLALALGLDDPRLQDTDEQIAEQILDTPAARAAGVTLEALRERAWMRIGYPHGTAPFAEGGFPTESGRVELRCDRLAADGLDPLVGYTPPAEIADPELALRFPLVLVVPATRFLLNSTFAAQAWHRDKTGPPRLFLHPDDAAARGIATGDQVRVGNDRGAFELEAIVEPLSRPGVCVTFKTHWPKLVGGANSNVTTPERDADMGGAPTFHDNRVEVTRS